MLYSERRLVRMVENPSCRRSFEQTLVRCQEVVKTFQGSAETLKHIQRVEECLRRLVDETNKEQIITSRRFLS